MTNEWKRHGVFAVFACLIGASLAPYADGGTVVARIEIPNLSSKTRGTITGAFVPDGKALVPLSAVVAIGRETRPANVRSIWDPAGSRQTFTVTIDGKGLPSGNATFTVKVKGGTGGQFKDVTLSRTD